MMTTKMRCVAALACMAALLGAAGCEDDVTRYSGGRCSGDDIIEFEGEEYCIVIEEGFLAEDCPANFPEGVEIEEVVVCGKDAPPEGIREELEERGIIEKDDEPDCLDPEDPGVDYVANSPQECSLIDYLCDEGTVSFHNECGCGCVSVDALQCPDPDDADVNYISDDPSDCARLTFMCDEGQEAFDDACGCGCIGDIRDPECADIDPPDTTYIGRSPAECESLFFGCVSGQEFYNDCGCGCIGEVQCPDPDNAEVEYISQDPTDCARIDFRCAEGQDQFFDECGCGCIGGGICPDPNDPEVGYISDDPADCARIDFQCAEGQEHFDGECGCGCIGPRVIDPNCPDPEDLRVRYVSQDPLECTDILFNCGEFEEIFSDECGCGCVLSPEYECLNPDDPNVSYVSTDPRECAEIDFDCFDEDYIGFDNQCGCGCRLRPELADCPVPEGQPVAHREFQLPDGCFYDPFFGELPTTVVEDEQTFLETFQCQEGTASGLDFNNERLVLAVMFENPSPHISAVIERDAGVLVQLNAPVYCGGPAPPNAGVLLVIPAGGPVEVGTCVYDRCVGPPRP